VQKEVIKEISYIIDTPERYLINGNFHLNTMSEKAQLFYIKGLGKEILTTFDVECDKEFRNIKALNLSNGIYEHEVLEYVRHQRARILTGTYSENTYRMGY